MRTDERIVMLPPFRVTRRVQMLAETKDYNHRLMNVPEIWKDSRGEGIKVAILDSGVPEHVDLASAGGESFIDGYYADTNGHASHCGGIVAALCDNGMGVCGIAPAVDDWYGAVLDGNGSGSIDSVVAGIRWAVDEVGADIISMSLGIAIPFPIRQLEDACNYAVEHGVAVIAAAGNEAGKVGQPGMYDSVITVAAVNSKQQHAAFSNAGKEVDFATGGVDVYSTYLNNSYATLSGTCLAKGTYVYTPTGPHKIEEMKIGDDVYAYKDGVIVTRKVTDVLYQGKNTVHHLNVRGRDVWATETHKFLAMDVEAKTIEWVPLKELQEKHRLIVPRGLSNTVNPYLDALITEEFAWLLGFFLGDGWISITGGGQKRTVHGARVAFANGDDAELLGKVKAIYEKYVGKSLTDNLSGGWCYDDSTKMAAVIDTLGLNCKAKNKTLPMWLWTVSTEKQQAFYRGYLAADGHDCITNIYAHPRKTFECASSDLIRRLAAFADYQGWQHSQVRMRERMGQAPGQKEPKLSTSFCLSIGEGAPTGNFGNFNTSTSKGGVVTHIVGRDRVSEFGVDPASFFLQRWAIVDDTAECDVYDLTVPDADCFIAQGLIVHNSMSTPAIAAIAALILAKHLKDGKKLTPEELRQHIKRIAYDVGGDGFDELYGHGIPIFRPGWDAEDGTPLPDPVITPPSGGGLFHKSSMGPAAGCQYWDLWTDFVGTVDGELAHKQDLQAALAEGIRRLARRTELVDRALRQKGA